MAQRLDLDELEAETIARGQGFDNPQVGVGARRQGFDELQVGRYLGEVVSTRSPVELLDPAFPGPLIRPARGIWVPGGCAGCWAAG